MRIALLSYRSKTHCGGQGVTSGTSAAGSPNSATTSRCSPASPTPSGLDPRVRLTEVPSLDLYREPDPFRIPRPSEIRDRIDLLEVRPCGPPASPSRKTFSLRAARHLAERRDDFDVVHDNQSLGYGLLDDRRAGLPVVATVHHPITLDRVLELAAATWWRKPPGAPLVRLRRDAEAGGPPDSGTAHRVRRRPPPTSPTTSASSPDQLHVVPLGVDTELFSPPADRACRGRIIAIASADVPLKGVSHLLQAVAAAARRARPRAAAASPSSSPTARPRS